MQIITISGLDGSGKSTQIELLRKYLESQGKRVFYFHAIQQGIAKKMIDFRNKYCPICRLSGKCKTSHQGKSITKASWFSIQLRKIFLRMDLCRFKKLIEKLEREGYDYLVSDRYFYDTVINIEYLKSICHRERNEVKRGDLEIASSQTPRNDIIKPNLSIYLQVFPETIMSRERVPDQGIEYLKGKKELYENKIGLWNMKVVDGNKNKDVIFEEIKSFLK
jgi:dTMP kinase